MELSNVIKTWGEISRNCKSGERKKKHGSVGLSVDETRGAETACDVYVMPNAQFTPPAKQDKTVLSVSCRAGWIESRDRLTKSEQLADRSPSSRGV